MEKTNKNTQGNRCAGCNHKMESLAGTGRALICRNKDCPYDKGKDWKDPYGFELVPIGSPRDKEEITVPIEIDLEDWGTD